MSNVVSHPKAGSRRRVRVPACPDHLSGYAKAEWSRAAGAMVAAGTFGPETVAVLEAYCAAYSRWRLAEEHVAEHGLLVPAPRTGTPMHNPFLAIGNKAADMLAKLANELGLTPIAKKRSGAGPASAAGEGGWDDDLLA